MSGNGKQSDPIKLSMFSVVLEGGDTAPLLDDALIRCQAGEQLVLAYVSHTALMDYFHLPGDMRVTLQQWNLAVDRNLEHGSVLRRAAPQASLTSARRSRGFSRMRWRNPNSV